VATFIQAPASGARLDGFGTYTNAAIPVNGGVEQLLNTFNPTVGNWLFGAIGLKALEGNGVGTLTLRVKVTFTDLSTVNFSFVATAGDGNDSALITPAMAWTKQGAGSTGVINPFGTTGLDGKVVKSVSLFATEGGAAAVSSVTASVHMLGGL
jgi:hypothetical protein